jgi:hypothetical protein
MPAKRTPLERRRKPRFDAETLALFTKLERTPLRARNTRAYQDDVHELMRRLNLVDEYWMMQSPLDRHAGPCHPPGYCAHDAWYRCRAVREALLEATARTSPALM